MSWDFSNDKPIFQQLVSKIILDIISGKYLPGDKLDAVRDLAVSAGVNPNTMQRALAEIENTGIIYTKRGDGRYVVEDKELILTQRDKYVNENTKSFIGSLEALGLDSQQIIEAVENALKNQN